MVDVRLEGDKVVFDVQGWHKLWALKGRLEIRRSNIRGARRDRAVGRGWKGWRIPGTHVPGVITAGTFYRGGKRVFWDVSKTENAVVVDVDDGRYKQLIIEVRDPDAVVRLLGEADA